MHVSAIEKNPELASNTPKAANNQLNEMSSVIFQCDFIIQLPHFNARFKRV